MTTTPGILGTGAKLGEDVQRDKTKEMLDWAKQFGVGPDGTLNPGVPPAVPAVGSKAWLDTQTGMGKAADTAYTQGPKTRNTEARTANTQAQTAYTQGPRTALTTAQANRVTTLLPSELELKLAQIEKLLSAPAPRGTGGGRTPSPPRPKPKPTTMTEREAARLAAAYPGQPPKVAKQMEQEGFAKGLPFEVSLATEGYWTEDKRTAYPTQFKYDQNALEIINASVASGVSKAQTMKRLADAGLLVKTLIGPGTQATARQNYEKIYDWIMKANGKTAPIPNFSKGGPFSPEDDMRKLAEQRVNGL